jgi:hypothetical protein
MSDAGSAAPKANVAPPTSDRPSTGDSAMSEAAFVRYDAMCAAIDAAYEVDEVKSIHDQAVALEAYARQAKNTEAERRACEIRLRAERKAGQISSKIERSDPGNRKKDLRTAVAPKSKQLRDAGISKKQATQWERLAAVPDKRFEAALCDQTHMPSTNGIIRANEKPKKSPVSADALTQRCVWRGLAVAQVARSHARV